MAFRPGKCLLHNILRDKKISPQEFADRVGFSKQQISDYANNRRKMNLSNAKTIAHALEIPIDELYTWVQSSRKRSRKNQSEQ